MIKYDKIKTMECRNNLSTRLPILLTNNYVTVTFMVRLKIYLLMIIE